jgi:hypothetical protein
VATEVYARIPHVPEVKRVEHDMRSVIFAFIVQKRKYIHMYIHNLFQTGIVFVAVFS